MNSFLIHFITAFIVYLEKKQLFYSTLKDEYLSSYGEKNQYYIHELTSKVDVLNEIINELKTKIHELKRE